MDMLDGIFSFVLLDTRDNSFMVARDAVGVTSLYIGWGLDGSLWVSSEMKGLHEDCEHFEAFPPGHLYSSKSGGGFKQWYNPPWFNESVPSTPYEPLAIRSAFEDVRKLFFFLFFFGKNLRKLIYETNQRSLFVCMWCEKLTCFSFSFFL